MGLKFFPMPKVVDYVLFEIVDGEAHGSEGFGKGFGPAFGVAGVDYFDHALFYRIVID